MNKETFNDLISFEYPDGFNKLSNEENEKFFTGDLMRLSFHNPEKHIIFSLSKSKDSFIYWLCSVATVVSNSLSNLESTLKDFEVIEEYKSTIFNQSSITECFSYTASDDGSKQYGELSVFKIKKAFYVVYCLSRFEDKENSKRIFKQLKESFTSVDEN